MVANSQGWELIGWRQAEPVANAYWRLTGLLRGRLETPVLQSEAGATVILVDDRLQTVELNAAQLNVPLFWQVGDAAPISHTYTET